MTAGQIVTLILVIFSIALSIRNLFTITKAHEKHLKEITEMHQEIFKMRAENHKLHERIMLYESKYPDLKELN